MLRRMFVAVAASLGLGVVSAARANEGRSLRLPFAPTPENATALAARAVAAVQNVDGKTLD